MHPCNLHDSILLPRLPYLARLIPQRLGRCPSVFAPALHSPQKTLGLAEPRCPKGGGWRKVEVVTVHPLFSGTATTHKNAVNSLS